ncbi:MAG: type II toxin-antitoxin system RelE/ParE family toxin [Deltaproteobacteria bacterium]|nr:type II toxin-antitoxin system RelE/ParE family toxin [Deltaproteobacteria bacterium]
MPKVVADVSSKFRIFETNEFQKCLKKLSVSQIKFIQQKLLKYAYPQLRQDPFLGPNIKKLKNYTPNTWRYRIADFRIFYTVDLNEKIIFIISLYHRKTAYR